jgi:hypothetical protein
MAEPAEFPVVLELFPPDAGVQFCLARSYSEMSSAQRFILDSFTFNMIYCFSQLNSWSKYCDNAVLPATVPSSPIF